MGLKNSNNLGDLSSPAIARRNLGLGTAAVKDAPLNGDASSTQLVLGSDSRLAGGTVILQPMGAFQPAATGADNLVFEIPYSTDGQSSLNWAPKRAVLLVTDSSGNLYADTAQVKLQCSQDGSVWSDVGTLSVTAASKAARVSGWTASILKSGWLLRVYVVTLPSASGYLNVSIQLNKA